MPPLAACRVVGRPSAASVSRVLSNITVSKESRRHKSGPYGYTQAKALVYSKYGEPSDTLFLHTHSISPSLPPTAVLLRALASPINPADINQIQGVYPSKPPLTALLGTALPSAVGGNEGCFEVLAAGASVTGLQRGDWVVAAAPGLGTWRTHLLAPAASALLRIPAASRAGLTPVQVGAVSVNPCTAYRLLRDFVALRPDRRDWLVQNGANGGVGRAALQLARRWGVRTLNVVREREAGPAATQALKRELAALGATRVVTEAELAERGFRERLMEWTDGGRERVRLGLNCVGGRPATALARCLSDGGHMVTYGAMARQPLQLPAGSLIFRNISFSGFWVSRWSEENPEEKRRTVEDILRMTREGDFKDVPVQKLTWDWDTDEERLKEAVQGTLQGFRAGKGVFVFGDT